MSSQPNFQAEAVHKAKERHLAEHATLHSKLDVNSKTYTTTSASGSIAYIFGYLQLDCGLNFPGGLNLSFQGKGLVVGLGATGSLGGQASFNVDPSTLIGATDVTFQAAGIGIVGGGFEVTWYLKGTYIGHGEFYGVGVQLGTPGGGWGTFS